VTPAAAHKGLDLRCELDPGLPVTVVGDGLRIRQIALNLLGNAVKFTEEGSVVLRVSHDPTIATLVLETEDTGIGIAADRQQAIFEEFVQADTAIAPKFGGTGLGLAITTQLVKLMEGTITLASEPGKGSTFRVTIPMAVAEKKPPASQLPAVEPQSGSGQCPRLLLAEDHDVNQQLFMGMLAQLGWKADLASDGAEALRMVEQAEREGNPYRLVLMDIQMPVMDGLEATRRIRESGLDGDRLPILALTANAFETDVAACFSAGSQAHIAKPVQLNDLARALRKWSGAAPATATSIKPAVRELYEARKLETLQALDGLSENGAFSSADLARVADLLHKLAGTAAMFGEPELGRLALAMEERIGGWTEADGQAGLREDIAAIRRAA
ncbi:ATP-binding protein, partial [Sphingomonas sp.]|uniref:ATP-binding protein n=1 Tax=Sphingomonas sp. TaxID=28214 RepID=UPI0025E03DB7